MVLEKNIHQRLFSIAIGKMEQISVLFLPHISFTSFCDITPPHNIIFLMMNRKDVVAVLSVVDVTTEVVCVVAEVVEAVEVPNQFAM